jgi:catechol 2,3-dioxygenase-like lactoylglutathione lyase family enzyme
MRLQLDQIGMVVADMGRALAFYRRLGFEFPDNADSEPHVEAPLRGGLRLAWDTVETIKSFDPTWQPPAGSSRTGFAFLCESPGEVDSTYRDLVDAGYEGHLEPFDAFWGQRYATVHDPDGNGVDLFAPLPVT